MDIEFVRVRLKYVKGLAILDLSIDDVVALVALADQLRGLVPAIIECNESPVAEDTASEWQGGTWRKYDPAS